MKISEIKKFLERIELALSQLKIKFDTHDDFYYCSKENKHCIVVPYISTMDFSFPDFKNCFNYIIISNGDYLGNNADVKFLTIADLENAVELSKKNESVVALIDLFFFNQNLNGVIKHVLEQNNSEVTSTVEKPRKVKNEEKTPVSSNEYKINIPCIEKNIGCKLSRVSYGYLGDNIYVFTACSKRYEPTNRYWYGYHNPSRDLMNESVNGFVCLFFKDRPQFLMIPKLFFNKYFDKLNSSKKGDKEWWHLYVKFNGEKCLWQVPNVGNIDVSEYLVKNESETKNINSENETEGSEAKLDSSVVIKITSTNFHTAKTKK